MIYNREKHSRRIMLFIVSFCLLSLSVGLAVLSSSLTINGTGQVNLENFNVYFKSITLNASSTSDIVANTPRISNGTTINNIAVSFPKDNSKAIYDIVVKNSGGYTAYLNYFYMSPVTCSGSDALNNEAVCGYIDVKFTDINSIDFPSMNGEEYNESLAPGEEKTLKLQLIYRTVTDISGFAKRDIMINPIDITMVYSQVESGVGGIPHLGITRISDKGKIIRIKEDNEYKLENISFSGNTTVGKTSDDYIKVDYIYGDGVNAITIPNMDNDIGNLEIDFYVKNLDKQYIFGSGYDSADIADANRHCLYINNSYLYYVRGNAVASLNNVLTPGKKYKFTYDDYSKNIVINDDSNFAASVNVTTTSFTESYDFKLLGSGAYNSEYSMFKGGISSFKVSNKDNNEMLIDLVPAISKSTGKLGFYNVVGNHEFYTSNNTECGITCFSYSKKYYDIPHGFTEVEYLRSDGRQLINTKWTGLFSITYEAKYDSNIGHANLMGKIGSGPNYFGVNYNGMYYIKTPVNSTNLGFVKNIITFTQTNNSSSLTVNNETITSNNGTAANSDLYLFGLPDYPGECGPMNLYSAIIYDSNGNEVRNYIPLLDESNLEGVLFDKLNNVIYRNVGEGKFQVGSYKREVPFDYIELLYLGSNGNQKINTGISGSFEANIVAEFNANTTGYQSFGNNIFGFGNDSSSKIFLRGNSNVVATGSSSLSTSKREYNLNYNASTNKVDLYLPNEKLSVNVNANSGNFYLFGDNSANANPSVKIFKAQIYQNGVLVRDFVPCRRKKDSVDGLYDRLSGGFYTDSSGTSSQFTLGPALVRFNDYNNLFNIGNSGGKLYILDDITTPLITGKKILDNSNGIINGGTNDAVSDYYDVTSGVDNYYFGGFEGLEHVYLAGYNSNSNVPIEYVDLSYLVDNDYIKVSNFVSNNVSRFRLYLVKKSSINFNNIDYFVGKRFNNNYGNLNFSSDQALSAGNLSNSFTRTDVAEWSGNINLQLNRMTSNKFYLIGTNGITNRFYYNNISTPLVDNIMNTISNSFTYIGYNVTSDDEMIGKGLTYSFSKTNPNRLLFNNDCYFKGLNNSTTGLGTTSTCFYYFKKYPAYFVYDAEPSVSSMYSPNSLKDLILNGTYDGNIILIQDTPNNDYILQVHYGIKNS